MISLIQSDGATEVVKPTPNSILSCQTVLVNPQKLKLSKHWLYVLRSNLEIPTCHLL